MSWQFCGGADDGKFVTCGHVAQFRPIHSLHLHARLYCENYQNQKTTLIVTLSVKMSISASPRRNLPRTQSTVNKKKSFIKYAKLGDEKSLLSFWDSINQSSFDNFRFLSNTFKLRSLTAKLCFALFVTNPVIFGD